MKEEIRTPKAPEPSGPYSQGIKAGNRIYVAGQRPYNVETGVMPEDIRGQCRQVLENVRHILEAGGATMDHVARVSVYLEKVEDFAVFNEVYTEFFSKPYPVRTTICCSLRGQKRVEVDCIAEL